MRRMMFPFIPMATLVGEAGKVTRILKDLG